MNVTTIIVVAGLLFIYLFTQLIVKICIAKWVTRKGVSEKKAESICKMFSKDTLNLMLSR